MKSIMPNGNEKVCYQCGTPFNLHIHHIFKGPNRKLADEDGCWVYLCFTHHTGDEGVHTSKYKWLDDQLKMKAQAAWEERYGSREDFRKRYGKSYL